MSTVVAANKEENSLGIPKAIFLEDVDKFMKEDNKNAEDVIKKLDELYQKYRLMEINLLQKKDKLKNQIPDIKMSLGNFRFLF
jgi:hypothetical protein